MTNKERDDMYQDWTDLLYQYLKGDGDEERQYALEELLLAIGSRVGVDVSQLVDKLNAYYTEACEHDGVPAENIKVGEVYRVINDEKGVYTFLSSGDIVRVLRKPNGINDVYVQSLMRVRFKGGDWYTKASNLEEV